MKLHCPACKHTVVRDSRTKMFRTMMTKRGYPSFCEEKGKSVFLIPQ